VHLKTMSEPALMSFPARVPESPLAGPAPTRKSLGSAPASVSSSLLTFGAVKKTPVGWPRNHFDFGLDERDEVMHDLPLGGRISAA
jgi:hypothetical protein